MPAIPRILMAGTHSGVGKTSLTLGLVSLLRRRGLRVQTFKIGPDYLDPTYLALASGRPCYNLDGWMTGREYVEDLFSRKTKDADIAVIEGVMGLYDGADPISSDGSSAQIAQWLDAPVLLVINAHGMARSFAAIVHGYSSFDSGVRIIGIIANNCGSEYHAQWLRESLEASSSARWLGAVMRGGIPELASRHLGLVSATADLVSTKLDQLADSLAPALGIDELLSAAYTAPQWTKKTMEQVTISRRIRLGIARDDAFHFYYPDNLEALERAGCELEVFSPLSDSHLPENLDGLYLGGGYPEEYAAELSANVCMRDQIRRFPGLIYGECGGLMYLAEGIETREGRRFAMVGLLPEWVRMGKRRKALGYVEVTFDEPTIWGRPGDTLRGHEYHYSEWIRSPDWQRSYKVRKRRSNEIYSEGFQRGSILASYIHLHFASQPAAVSEFVRHLGEK
jgi:cobyrinic acid a,c-diamide synthase